METLVATTFCVSPPVATGVIRVIVLGEALPWRPADTMPRAAAPTDPRPPLASRKDDVMNQLASARTPVPVKEVTHGKAMG